MAASIDKLDEDAKLGVVDVSAAKSTAEAGEIPAGTIGTQIMRRVEVFLSTRSRSLFHSSAPTPACARSRSRTVQTCSIT
jgi:hypothetical protein